MLMLRGRLTFLAAACTVSTAARLFPFASRPSPSRVRSVSASAGAEDTRLTLLRAEMKRTGVDAFVVPSGDPHLSEYVHPFYERRAFISDFTGSAGTVVVTQEVALLCGLPALDPGTSGL